KTVIVFQLPAQPSQLIVIAFEACDVEVHRVQAAAGEVDELSHGDAVSDAVCKDRHQPLRGRNGPTAWCPPNRREIPSRAGTPSDHPLALENPIRGSDHARIGAQLPRETPRAGQAVPVRDTSEVDSIHDALSERGQNVVSSPHNKGGSGV